MSESDFYLLFSLSPEIGPKRFQNLILQFGSVQNAWENLGSDKNLKINNVRLGEATIDLINKFKSTFSLADYKEKLAKARVLFIPQNSADYPQELMSLDNPPIGLFVKGDGALLQSKKFGIVGTRKITSYGKDVTQMLSSGLVTYGYTIVSGLALGVDAVAHRAALDTNGTTIAVLGCGVDCCNPAENKRLYDEIISRESLIISEYPLGTLPTKGSFPARNRIIAALSQGLLVTEAGADSGSLITAAEAKKLDKYIFAVPGPITSKQSDGTSYLLQQGATLVTSASDIAQKMGVKKSAMTAISIEKLAVTSGEKNVLLLMQDEEQSFDELVTKSKSTPSTLGVLLGNLELLGYVYQRSDGKYSLTKA